jgi:hypothetical protein
MVHKGTSGLIRGLMSPKMTGDEVIVGCFPFGRKLDWPYMTALAYAVMIPVLGVRQETGCRSGPAIRSAP